MKHLLNKWTVAILALMKPLGIWGVLVFAAVDAGFLGMPVDAIVAGYVWADPQRLLMYSVMAAAGSALGSIFIYAIGYKGGEFLVVKRMGEARFNKIKASFERHEFLALMLPSMLPPPTPFKLFVLSAGVAEMNFGRFLGAIFTGRLLRFALESFLVIRFGPGFVFLLGQVFHHHLRYALAAVATLCLLGWWIWWARRRKSSRTARNGTQSAP